MRLVISGAYYYDRDNDMILIPHFTGEYSIVDCSTYEQMERLVDKYNKGYIDSVQDYPIEFEGRQYYDTEYSPIRVDDWELLSDLSDIRHEEVEVDF